MPRVQTHGLAARANEPDRARPSRSRRHRWQGEDPVLRGGAQRCPVVVRKGHRAPRQAAPTREATLRARSCTGAFRARACVIVQRRACSANESADPEENAVASSVRSAARRGGGAPARCHEHDRALSGGAFHVEVFGIISHRGPPSRGGMPRDCLSAVFDVRTPPVIHGGDIFFRRRRGDGARRISEATAREGEGRRATRTPRQSVGSWARSPPCRPPQHDRP
jgi:hypothetical protein